MRARGVILSLKLHPLSTSLHRARFAKTPGLFTLVSGWEIFPRPWRRTAPGPLANRAPHVSVLGVNSRPSLRRYLNRARLAATALAITLVAAGCQREPHDRFQGYLEGDFVQVSAPLAGRLEHLAVTKGQTVDADAPLFSLERAAELAARQQAADRLANARARLADLRKGSRPTELAALAARLEQARSAAELSRLEWARVDALLKNKVATASEHDRARLTHEHDRAVVAELEAQLETARLGGRPDAIAAAAAEVAAAEAAKAQADWSVEQKSQRVPASALVFDTLYREGEFVGPGLPVVTLLPPGNLKVRFFAPEERLAELPLGRAVHVSLSGLSSPLAARVSYVSARPEYTPPVLYNRENRAKLVFMVEARFDTPDAHRLHPGQPVDVALAR